MTDYSELCDGLAAITEGVPYRTANLANASALIWDTLDGINWAGFYLVENGKLVLNAFQGKVACVEIERGHGVCGAAWEKNETQLVPDVHKFSGHIACDSASNSEIVVPLRRNGEVAGVLDIDSPLFSRFDETDRAGLEKAAAVIEKLL